MCCIMCVFKGVTSTRTEEATYGTYLTPLGQVQGGRTQWKGTWAPAESTLGCCRSRSWQSAASVDVGNGNGGVGGKSWCGTHSSQGPSLTCALRCHCAVVFRYRHFFSASPRTNTLKGLDEVYFTSRSGSCNSCLPWQGHGCARAVVTVEGKARGDSPAGWSCECSSLAVMRSMHLSSFLFLSENLMVTSERHVFVVV